MSSKNNLNVSDFEFFVPLCDILEPGDSSGYLEFLDRWSAETRLESFISDVVRFILRMLVGIFSRFVFTRKIPDLC